MTHAATATGTLGRFAAGCASEALAPEVTAKAVACLLDALGLAILAREERTYLAARALVTPVGFGPGVARIWADGKAAPLSEAVATNAIAVHAQFHDDCDHMSWSHPGSLVVPVAVGAVEASAGSLHAVLRAIVSGYATISWLGAEEAVARALIGRGLRGSPVFGTLGAAAAAATAMGLDEGQAANAVAMAASITGGVLEPVRAGSDEWRLQNAHAARGGLSAAQLAQRGVRGAASALEGPKGLLRSLAGMERAPAAWATPPRPEAILGIYAKPWATLGDNMAPVRAAKLLHGDGIDADAIRAVRVRMWRAYTEYPGTSYRGPFDTTVQALASTAFATAAMLCLGELEYDVSHERRRDPRILRLAQLVAIEPTDEETWQDATVEVELADGRRVARRAREAPRVWLYPDAARAADVLEQRLAGAGYAPGTGRALAADVSQAAASPGSPLPIRTVLDRLERRLARDAYPSTAAHAAD